MIVNSLNLLYGIMNIIQRINKYLLENSSTCGDSTPMGTHSLSYQEFERESPLGRDIFPVNEDPENPLGNQSFINNLIKNGYEYDNDKDWYVRSWTTNSPTHPDGEEKILQIWKKKWVEVLTDPITGEIFHES